MVLESVLVLLAAAVAAVALCRVLKLPALVGYLATGLALGPHALRVASNAEETQSLAEFGVVFLMFSIGLEFSLAKLHAMRRVVFGLGGAQVLGSMALALVAALALGLPWQAGFALGAIAAMSSTAIVSKLLAERGELDTAHGRDVIGVLLFQDLAVVPLLVLLPALAEPRALGPAVLAALGKAALALALVVLAGPALMRGWLGSAARARERRRVRFRAAAARRPGGRARAGAGAAIPRGDGAVDARSTAHHRRLGRHRAAALALGMDAALARSAPHRDAVDERRAPRHH